MENWEFGDGSSAPRNGLESSEMQLFKNTRYYSLAREICQNSIDAKLPNKKTAIVEIDLFEITPDEIKGINTFREELDKCINEVKDRDVNSLTMLKEMSKEVNSSMYISCLKISDYNTTGLSNAYSYDKNGGFFNITKGNGTTTKLSGSTGGSKGLGKYSLFNTSKLNMVFYSTYNENGEKAYMGVTKLLSRTLNIDNRYTSGYGYYYDTKDSKPIRGSLALGNTRERTETGTDIYIIAPENSKTILKDMITSILDSYIYAINQEILIVKLNVSGNNIEISKKNLKNIVNNQNLINKKYYNSIMSQYIMMTDKDVFSKSINITSKDTIQVYIKDFTKDTNKYSTKKCAMIRYPYMKIMDIKIGSITDTFSAMCIIENNELNNVLKFLENPQHNSWDEKEYDNYPNKSIAYENIVIRIEKAINDYVDECLLHTDSEQIDVSGAGEYLPVDATGNIEPKNIIFDEITTTEFKDRNIINNPGDEENQNANAPIMDIGEGFDEETIPQTTREEGVDNDSSPKLSDEPALGDKSNKDMPIQKIISITGIITNVMLLNKNEGKYLIRFNSIYNEKDCYLDLYYLDSNGNRYKPNIFECKINGLKYNAHDNRINHFKIKNKHQYSFELTTDMRDYFRCEVELYVYK